MDELDPTLSTDCSLERHLLEVVQERVLELAASGWFMGEGEGVVVGVYRRERRDLPRIEARTVDAEWARAVLKGPDWSSSGG